MNEEELILNNINLIYVVLKRMGLYHKADELYDIGLIGLVKGAKKYDPARGYSASTYLYRCIYNEFLMSQRRVRSGREIPHYQLTSLSTEISDTITLEDVLQDTTNIEEEIIKKEQINTLYKELAKLTEQEQLIIKLAFGLGEYKKTNQTKIGKMLNMSQAQVSRIKDKAIAKIRENMDIGR